MFLIKLSCNIHYLSTATGLLREICGRNRRPIQVQVMPAKVPVCSAVNNILANKLPWCRRNRHVKIRGSLC